jgi:hypothetical protein
MRKVFADDVAAGGAEYVADKEDVHLMSLHGQDDCGFTRIDADREGSF